MTIFDYGDVKKTGQHILIGYIFGLITLDSVPEIK